MGLMDILSQYTQNAMANTADASSDFEQVAQQAPPEELADGIAHAFRAEETPPFGEMVGHLFGRSDPQQRASLLNELVRFGGAGGLGSLGGGILGSILQRAASGGSISPQQASQVPAEQVEDLAHQAAKQDPSIIERVSRFYAQHPALVQTLGSAALSIAMGRMAQRRAG